MEYTELSDYRLHPGILTGWVGTADPSQWREDPRPLSANHEAHVLDSLAGEEQVAPEDWIGTAFRIRRPLDHDAFAETLRRWHARHEAYRTTAVRGSDGTGVQRKTLPADAVDVRTIDLGRVGTTDPSAADAPATTDATGPDAADAPAPDLDIQKAIRKLFSREISVLRWPHLAVATIDPYAHGWDAAAGEANAEDALATDDVAAPGDGWFTVVFGADHAIMDAYTQIFSIAELTELYRSVLDGTAAELPPTGSYVDFSTIERAAADLLDADHPAVARWREFLAETNGFSGAPGTDAVLAPPRFPLPVHGDPADADGGHRADGSVAPDPAGDTVIDPLDAKFDRHGQLRQRSLSRWIFDDATAKAFADRSKELGSSQMGGFLTALKIALTSLSGGSEVRYIMPMHTRTSPEYALAAGWFVGLMPVADPLGDATSFPEALSQTTASVMANRDLVGHPYARVAQILDVTEPPRFVVSYVDTRHIPGATAWTPHERALRSSIHSDDDVYLWINRGLGGLNVSMRYPDTAVAAESVERFLAAFTSVVEDVVATGDHAIARVLSPLG
ncbi:condensation domain-containing protein [Corynebacterium bovis]|uniref:condensation domain-containing protein n=1 Tax=Corynebacterium bovis TaxID=36808 RepID=UPI003139F879